MKKRTRYNLRLAIQKKGRLTEETIAFLRHCGLMFEISRQRLYSSCRNFPLKILYVRDDDIPEYVQSGTVDLGIIGQNVLYERRPKVKKVFNLQFGYCSLVVAVPRESTISSIKDLKGENIATTYPKSTKDFFRKRNIEVNVVPISGSVEITPTLGFATAITDLTSTGSTLALNDLRVLSKIADSEAVLIANREIISKQQQSRPVNQLLTRFNAVLSAQTYKCVIMSVPESTLSKLKKVIPGLKSPAFTSPQKNKRIFLQTIMKEKVLWNNVDRLRKMGASTIIVLPVEKAIA